MGTTVPESLIGHFSELEDLQVDRNPLSFPSLRSSHDGLYPPNSTDESAFMPEGVFQSEL